MGCFFFSNTNTNTWMTFSNELAWVIIEHLDTKLFIGTTRYKCLYRSLQYPTIIHLNIPFTIYQPCKHRHSPTTGHLFNLDRVLKYNKVMSQLELLFELRFMDSNLVRSLTNKKSKGDLFVFVSKNFVSWTF